MKTHRELDVWRVALDLAKDVYRVTNNFPKEEQFGLVAQMRRSAVSIPTNIAEGAGRKGTKEFIQFLYVAVGSACELDTQLEIARAVVACDESDINRLRDMLVRVTMMTRGLIRSLKS
jgi:four helix bundle protein